MQIESDRLQRGLQWAALVLAAGAALLSLQAYGAEEVNPEADGIVFERQQIMEQLDKDADKLGSIAAGEVPADQVAATTSAIAQGARDSVEAFKQKVPGGRAKPEVWSNYADFSARMEKFAVDAEAMAKAGKANNMAGVMEMMVTALPCQECHNVYREKKKS